jgi:hypothetical protein
MSVDEAGVSISLVYISISKERFLMNPGDVISSSSKVSLDQRVSSTQGCQGVR